MTLRTVCVFCGSSDGVAQAYHDAARELGGEIARRGFGLVYGGARVGLMGTLADGALAAGGTVTGVLPRAMETTELAHRGLTTLHVVDSMHERKAMMARLADAFVALPGGFGTFEEFFEIVTWQYLGIHGKPCGLLNAERYFDRLIDFVDQSVDEGFTRPAQRAGIIVAATAPAMLDALAAFHPPEGRLTLAFRER